MEKPELVAPADNLEMLKLIVRYGADAAAVSCTRFSAKATVESLSDTELQLGVEYAKKHDTHCYVSLNSYLLDEELHDLAHFCQVLQDCEVSGVMVSDLGVARVVADHCDRPLHLSLRSGCLNSGAAAIWRNLGVRRLILGKDTTVEEAGRISTDSGLPVEMYIHGDMCMAYAGQCHISKYTTGRDANRGDCTQACRFCYEQKALSQRPIDKESEIVSESHFLSSRDLSAVDHVARFFQHHIDAVKIEGRGRSALYLATVLRSYRELFDSYFETTFTESTQEKAREELDAVPHRPYTEEVFDIHPTERTVHAEGSRAGRRYQMVGTVAMVTENEIGIHLQQNLSCDEKIEILPFRGLPVIKQVESLRSVSGEARRFAERTDVVFLPRQGEHIEPRNVVRRFAEGEG